jgi:hypothetical protein
MTDCGNKRKIGKGVVFDVDDCEPHLNVQRGVQRKREKVAALLRLTKINDLLFRYWLSR